MDTIHSGDMPKVVILLSTFNGQAYVEQLLDSILRQDYPFVKLRVRDDGSTDNTVNILKKFSRKYSGIHIYTGENIGCSESFFELLRGAAGDVIMFCDQDDIWLPTKVSSAVKALSGAGLHRPVMYHTDLTVVDDQLRTVAPSFMAQQNLRLPQAHRLEVLSIQNCVVGCTAAITSKLAAVALRKQPRPGAVAMHDWWLALVAKTHGDIIYSNQSEILYRQHGSNLSGAKKRGFIAQLKAQFSAVGLARINSYRARVSNQAAEFLDIFEDEMGAETNSIMRHVVKLHPSHGATAVFSAFRKGIRFQNWYMNIALVFTSLATRLFTGAGAGQYRSLVK
jgi:hypothetical protein